MVCCQRGCCCCTVVSDHTFFALQRIGTGRLRPILCKPWFDAIRLRPISQTEEITSRSSLRSSLRRQTISQAMDICMIHHFTTKLPTTTISDLTDMLTTSRMIACASISDPCVTYCTLSIFQIKMLEDLLSELTSYVLHSKNNYYIFILISAI